jgi:hypothetical protein
LARLFAFLLWLAVAAPAAAQAVSERPAPGAVALAVAGRPGAILVDPADDPGVLRAARDLAADFGRVTGAEARLAHAPAAGIVVIAGTVGRSPLIDRLAKAGKVDLRGVAGRWEAYVHQVVVRPLPGVRRALVIAGADRRGTIFGIYDLSQQIGVSPWYWWADVAPRRHAALYALPGRRVEAPAVKYRGIFLNDEEPALGGWARKTFGGLNHLFYRRVFELILRQRGNLLWPAMWGKSFFEDDPENARLAEEMGVVISTSHHEPLMRAQQDWHSHAGGAWDYTMNAGRLRAFWREGVTRTNFMDRLVTIGMRGDGDAPMMQGTATKLLETIVADQRAIIAEATGRPAAQTPQVWALYKEVQDYYDAGMRVPDDVTLLFSDDNWGNIRRLPEPGQARAGGTGVYYHFDYVGDPRNYKWIDTVQLGRVAEQMRLAYDHGARRLWIANVGDLKPLELPTGFFLDYAWNPDAWPLERVPDYASDWAARQFGSAQARAIGAILTRYGDLAARRKPELLAPDTYSLDEWDRVAGEWRALGDEAWRIAGLVPTRDRDAYLELVLHKVLAFANLHELYRVVALNRAHAAQGLADTNALAEQARRLFAWDAELRRLYEGAAGGKWPEMMAQTHIGYTGWQQPDRDAMPEVKTLAAPGKPAPPRDPVAWRAAAVDAVHFTRAVPAAGLAWRTIPNLGRTGAAVAAFPMTAPAAAPGKGPRLDYAVTLPKAGEVTLEVEAAPDLDVSGQGRLRYAIAVDDEAPQAVNLLAGETPASWARAVAENVRRGTTRHHVARPGRHVVHIWAVDPQILFERVVAAWGPLPSGSLGPPEERR